LAFDSAGNLFEADANSGTIFEFAPNGSPSTFASGLFSPDGLAFDSSGNLYVGEIAESVIFKFTSDGTQSTFASVDSPTFLAFAPAPAGVPDSGVTLLFLAVSMLGLVWVRKNGKGLAT